VTQIQWPPDYLAEFQRRIAFGEAAYKDILTRKALLLVWKDDPVRFINDCCITHDPRNRPPLPKLMPFLLFQRQEEFVWFLKACLDDKESGLVEKARDIGASWLCCAFTVWLWLFWDETTVGWGSRKEEYVDAKGDPKAIFPKIRQIIDALPEWVKPEGYNPVKHATYMRIVNPQNGSVISGEAGDNIGRGGRTTIFFKDESAHYERPELIEAALGDNTDVQIDISSVNGTANVFYRRRNAGEVWAPGKKMEKGKTRVFIFDWRDHPGKSQEWYEMRRKKAENEGLLHVFKQEVDRDYSGSVDRIIIPQEWVKAAIDAHLVLPKKYPEIYGKMVIEGEKVAMQDVADEGGDKNALVARHGILCNHAEHWAGEAGEAAEKAIPECTRLGVKELYYDSIGVGVGFKTQVNTMKEKPSWPMHMRVLPWNAGATPLDPEDHIIPGDDESPLNKDQYGNLKAQGWFRVRARFYKTFRAVTQGDKFPVDELISLDSTMPTIHELCQELSQAVRKKNGEGKTIVDKKPDGARSPNLADALIGCYNPTKEASIFDAL